MVVIIDYGMGNLFSVENAIKYFGAEVKISDQKEEIEKADRLILPGVGAFPDGMKNLEKLGIIDVLKKEALEKEKPFLGICLGMQLLAAEGEENILTKGLGWVPGKVKRLQVDERKFRIPHVGWDDVIPKKDGMLFKAVKQPVFYFVHSYHLVPEDSSVIAGVCDYGESFAAAIQKDNIFGVQFHPEKSQKNGLAVLKNFLDFT
ncbi:MAG: imidazole glycerol phosphate synthase, glutamine amidotransferase subunit [Candidatus Harrisonbacteria bacterium RIFCSPLOWO2_02_FULL_45_10c]|uniref:Imidazole glycerol phosphate synthase subunit HisH n=1 Tax=Candidatus Harrisonbacteria bacterium RIFCSPLOWO2_02_FULL_45_10c TaxID=1798410 RepID=A0A1G1ZS99_9BACT|nr:MAG: imidazole glycerol phosphate synthase, glutamine amidotransferase subunit [Candidatus Harrisonbacteria bacterium RIFCSPLOWO2_02_FULL_45_10c]